MSTPCAVTFKPHALDTVLECFSWTRHANGGIAGVPHRSLHESHGNGLEYQLPLFRVVDDYIATGINLHT